MFIYLVLFYLNSMRKIMFFRFGSRYVHLPKLIGAFLIASAVLLFFAAGAQMFDSWDTAKFLNKCLDNKADYGFSDCQNTANSSGLTIRPDQSRLSGEQYASLLLRPIAELFAWAVLFIIGIILYLTGKLVIPVEQTVREISEKKRRRRG